MSLESIPNTLYKKAHKHKSKNIVNLNFEVSENFHIKRLESPWLVNLNFKV